MTLPIEHNLFSDTNQWVCLQCGYNMIGTMPDVCPFCGAYHDQFLPWDEAETKYHVIEYTINNDVSQLISVPKLGYEHAAYRIETAEGAVWVDSPSAFNRGLAPVDAILFTHHHFMGASNQYRRIWNAEIWLHDLDARHRLAASFTIDHRFLDDFNAYGIEAYHIGGHTPGFTFYIYQDVLFVCDYVFLTDASMSFNPYGPEQETIKQASRIYEVVKHKSLKTVCGFNYTADFADWMVGFERLIGI
jgi:hydroxyacylglutathione hydrolase